MHVRLPAQIEAAVRQFRRQVEAELPGRVARVVVFGSVARGEAHEESDVDVLVLLTAAEFAERRRVIELGAEIGFAHDLVMAPLVQTVDEWAELVARERLLTRDIEADGIEVHE